MMTPDENDHVVDLWLARFFCDDDGGYPDIAQSEDVASALAWLDKGLSERLDKLDAQTKVRVQLLARALMRQHIDHRAERTRDRAKLAAAAARIAALEDALREQADAHASALAALAKQVAGVERTAARDRSLRRMVDARRSYPRPDRAALEAAKRKTDRAINGGLHGGADQIQ